MAEGFSVYFTQILDPAHSFQILIISIACVIVLTPPARTPKSIAFVVLKTCGVFVICMLLEMILFAISKVTRAFAGICFPIAYMITVALYSLFFCKFTPKFRIIMSGSLFSSGMLVTELIKQFAFIMPVKDDMVVSLVVILINLLNLVTAFILTRFSLVKYADISVAGMVLSVISNSLIVVAVFVYEVLMMHVFTENVYINQTYTGVSALFLYIIEVSAYLMVYFICKGDREIATLLAEKKMAEADRELMRLTDKNLSDIRQIRHDVKNHFAYMGLLIESGKYDDLKKYIGQMDSDILKPLIYIDCGNKIINVIMNMEKAKAEACGLVFDARINVPSELPFKDTSLCSLISNLIDNAIEACEREGLGGAEITVKACIRQEYFYIGVTNPLPEGIDTEKLLNLNTSKKDHGVHGLGTKIIQRIADEYNGYVTYSAEKGYFIAEVMLDLVRKGEK